MHRHVPQEHLSKSHIVEDKAQGVPSLTPLIYKSLFNNQ